MNAKTKKIFIAVVIFFIIAGLIVTMPYLSFVVVNRKQLIDNHIGITDTMKEIKDNASYRAYYNNKKKDLVSLYYRTTKKTEVSTWDGKIVLSDEGYLFSPVSKVNESDVASNCKRIRELKDYSNKCGAEFLYVYVPAKGQLVTIPSGLEDYSEDNYKLFLDNLNEQNVETLDLNAEADKDNKGAEDLCFITDGHWKPEAGFWASGKICSELNKRYGFEYNAATTDINNYNIKVYKNWFLGLSGKATGRYFSPLGVDDFSLITPKFDTDITESRPFENETASGDFESTLIDFSEVKYKNLYYFNTYAAYSYSDRRLQIAVNNKADNDDKILIVRNSFGSAVTPFLALNCKELHVVDIRNYDYLGEEKVDLASYIKEVKPDYVIVLYNSVISQDTTDQFKFFD